MAINGLVAEGLCRGLQILVCRFDSDPSLQIFKQKHRRFAGVLKGHI